MPQHGRRSVLAIIVLGDLADLIWMTGDLEAAAAALEAIALKRGSPLANEETLGVCLANLAGVLTERGELDEALPGRARGHPVAQQGRHRLVLLDHLALRAALAGKPAIAMYHRTLGLPLLLQRRHYANPTKRVLAVGCRPCCAKPRLEADACSPKAPR